MEVAGIGLLTALAVFGGAGAIEYARYAKAKQLIERWAGDHGWRVLRLRYVFRPSMSNVTVPVRATAVDARGREVLARLVVSLRGKVTVDSIRETGATTAEPIAPPGATGPAATGAGLGPSGPPT